MIYRLADLFILLLLLGHICRVIFSFVMLMSVKNKNREIEFGFVWKILCLYMLIIVPDHNSIPNAGRVFVSR